jgi:hypothetical protein
LIILSLQIADAVERFPLPLNGSKEAPEAMDVTLTPYLAPPLIWLIGRTSACLAAPEGRPIAQLQPPRVKRTSNDDKPRSGHRSERSKSDLTSASRSPQTHLGKDDYAVWWWVRHP